jgi:hypothetical protein
LTPSHIVAQLSSPPPGGSGVDGQAVGRQCPSFDDGLGVAPRAAKVENPAAAVAMFMAAYNFTWRPRFPDQSGRVRGRRVTPAMAAGVVSELWTAERLSREVIG